MIPEDDIGIRWWHYGVVVAFHPFDWCWRLDFRRYGLEFLGVNLGPFHLRISP